MDLEEVGECLRIGSCEEAFDVLEEPFTGHVAPEQFILQGSARPLGPCRILRSESRFIKQRDHSEYRQLHIGLFIAHGLRLLVGATQQLQHLRSKCRGVGYRLTVRPKPGNRGKGFLQEKG